MPFFGRHSRQPEGNPAVMSAIAEAAAGGDRATLEAIARGGRASLGQWQDIQWSGDPKKEDERQEERALAQAFLSGNSAEAQRLYDRAGATYKPATGGTIGDIARVGAKIAPIAALAIPGIGPLAGAAITAGANAARQATDVQGGFDAGSFLRAGATGAAAGTANQGVLGGQGVLGVPNAVSAAGRALPGMAQRAASGGGVPGAPGGGGTGTDGTGGGVPGGSGGGGGGIDIGSLLAGGMNMAQAQQAAAQVARANAMREQAASGAQRDYASRDPLRQYAMSQLMQGPAERPDFSSAIADPSNPFASPVARPPISGPPPLASLGTPGSGSAPSIPPAVVQALTGKPRPVFPQSVPRPRPVVRPTRQRELH